MMAQLVAVSLYFSSSLHTAAGQGLLSCHPMGLWCGAGSLVPVCTELWHCIWFLFPLLNAKTFFGVQINALLKQKTPSAPRHKLNFLKGLHLSKIHRLKAVAWGAPKWSSAPSAAQWMQMHWCVGKQCGACNEPGVLAPGDCTEPTGPGG